MRKRKIKIILLISVALCVAAVLPLSTRGSYQNKDKADYSRFTHKTHSGAVKIPGSEDTQELKCDSCHERQTSRASRAVATTERNDRLQLNFPGHNTCVECHITQFTLRQTCAICHIHELSALPPQRDFPARRDFNAYFDGKQHADHVNKYALPNGGKLDCNYCHKPTTKQAALTIASHPECYVCHAPGSGDAKASLKADCDVCHRSPAMPKEIEPFSAKYKSRAYGASFTHRTHITYAGGKKCDACHTIEGAYNQPLPAPSKIRVKEHLSPGERSGRGCFSCHDGGTHYWRVVFSGEDASRCANCHKTQDKNGRPLVLAADG